jgi:uncharacterized protein with FMN-binding domain
MDKQTEGANPAGQWLRNNLVTLGTAAVFSVYSAGYYRTRAAAERFAGEAVPRRVMAAPLTKANPATDQTEAAPQAKSELPVMRLSSTHEPVAPRRERPTTVTAGEKAAPRADSSPTLASPTVISPLIPPTRPAEVVSPLAPPIHPAEVVSPPAPQPAPAPPPDSAAVRAQKTEETTALKDGVYYGWGTSRHGDIQASVEIKDGKIVGAYISQCLTQYSCSWVSALPPEVVQRQSAEVDYVSGATQSSNAFYYAIAEALKKAK